MTRFTHLILLLLALAIILRVGLNKPSLVVEDVVTVDQTNGTSEIPGKAAFNPEVPIPLPDLNEGYIFAQDRELSESDLNALNKNEAPVAENANAVDLEDVSYSGSIIIGDLRRALVSYPSVKEASRKGGRTPARGGRKAVEMNQVQLDQGEEFMGFLVAVVDEDKIVFEKNGERVEKFLYDLNKERKIAAKTGESAAKRSGENNGAAVAAAATKPLPPPDLPQRRSQQRLKALSGAGILPPPAGK